MPYDTAPIRRDTPKIAGDLVRCDYDTLDHPLRCEAANRLMELQEENKQLREVNRHNRPQIAHNLQPKNARLETSHN